MHAFFLDELEPVLLELGRVDPDSVFLCEVSRGLVDQTFDAAPSVAARKDEGDVHAHRQLGIDSGARRWAAASYIASPAPLSTTGTVRSRMRRSSNRDHVVT